MAYKDFVDLEYHPDKKDLICLFKIKPNRVSIQEAAGAVASESSIGTWTEVKTQKSYVNKLGAKVFSIQGDLVKIAYPYQLFEGGNAPNILSSIAGNIFGMKIVKKLRLEDVKFPKEILNSFHGPRYGIKGIRKIMKIKKRPLLGTIVKPKLGLKTKDHAQVAYESWIGGCDFVKDDENLSSQKFNDFHERLARTLEKLHQAEDQTGEKKAYLVNVTAETEEMLRRTKLVEELGGKFVMIDILTSGFAAVQTLRENTKLAIHAHRAMHGAFTEDKEHGINMMVIADLARLIGVDSLHIGTAVGKMKGSYKEIKEIEEEIELPNVKKTKYRLEQNWGKIKPTIAVSSGGISPINVPDLIKYFGKDLIIQMGGGIHGHPRGTYFGARAARQSIDAVLAKKSLKEYSKNHEELKEALRKWG